MESTRIAPLASRTRVALAIARGVAAAIRRINWRRDKSLGFRLEHSLGEPPGYIPPRLVTIDVTPGEEELTRLAEIEMRRRGDPYLGTNITYSPYCALIRSSLLDLPNSESR